MEVKEIDGSLFDTECEVIAHQVNCARTMASGVAREIRDRYPKNYKAYTSKTGLLGDILITQEEDRYIANLYGQSCFGYDNKKYTNYEALYSSLNLLKDYMMTNNLKSVAFPYGMGSVRGGGAWGVVFELIKSTFQDTDVKVEIWKLN